MRVVWRSVTRVLMANVATECEKTTPLPHRELVSSHPCMWNVVLM